MLAASSPITQRATGAWLPMASGGRPTRQRPERPAPGTKGEGEAQVKLLLVDDEAAVLEAGAVFLAEAGFDVVTAGGGSEAMRLIAEQQPDVVVLDLMMPDVNGWHVWDWIQQQSTRPAVVIWTASGLRTGAIGRTTIVPKGADPSALLDAIDDSLAHS
jgi:CheY-like chemotaxis protein